MNHFQSPAMYMKTKYIIIFVLCVLLLAGSEYLFLVELNSLQRLYILFFTSVLALLSIITIFYCYRYFNKDINE
jgi:hypothetical protein